MIGRLLELMTEEEAFWTFAMIVESFLPIDYYSNIFGALIDQQIFSTLLEQRLPKLDRKLKELELDISMFTMQWFACLFSYNVPQKTLRKFWDLIFVCGRKMLFRFSLSLMAKMEKDLMYAEDFCKFLRLT
jgi:hypothetical protein